MRVRRIALLDPIHEVAYSRSHRKDTAGYKEDAALQSVLDDKGLRAARLFAMRRYLGVQIAVFL